MNERIRELAISSGIYDSLCDPYDSHNTGDAHGSVMDDLEKFAELIMCECLAYGKLTQSQVVVNGSEEYNAGREMGIEVFMNQIKKHFGVEE